MNRQEAKELLPIIQAFAEGKKIEVRVGNDSWTETDEVYGGRNNDYDYRIKTEPKYRPFKNKKECWEEMLKHQPFGWIKKTCGHCNFLHIMGLYSTGIIINDVDNFGSFRNFIKTYDSTFAKTTFADGTPFGIKE